LYHARHNDSIALRLEAGELVHDSLCAVCAHYGAAQAFVVSGIGMLSDPLLGWYEVEAKRYHEQSFPGRHELLNLSGNISLREGAPFAHLHAVLSHTDYSCFGGHLFSAAVGLTLEVLIQLLPSLRMDRTMEEQWGLPGLLIRDGEGEGI
jgi:predicted DNA-binding protein with PD1-like motif